jgi:hypothetical protein
VIQESRAAVGWWDGKIVALDQWRTGLDGGGSASGQGDVVTTVDEDVGLSRRNRDVSFCYFSLPLTFTRSYYLPFCPIGAVRLGAVAKW